MTLDAKSETLNKRRLANIKTMTLYLHVNENSVYVPKTQDLWKHRTYNEWDRIAGHE